MERVKTLVIGAGAVGLAIGCHLSKNDPDLVIVDKETGFGKHTSSRNSEVIHNGHYYPPGSLKARLCVRGNRLLYDYLDIHAIAHAKTGKIIVAMDESELELLDTYLKTGQENGCQGMTLLSRVEVLTLEPGVKCVGGLYVPATGIFNTHGFMSSLESLAEHQGAITVYGMEVLAIRREDGQFIVEFANGEAFQCQQLINSGGLWADQLARMAGLDVDKMGLNLHWCKGEYYKTNRLGGIRHLIYPVADPKGVFLGIHLTLNLNGEIRFGPNAYYRESLDYRFDEGFLDEFHRAVSRYLEVNVDDLMPDDTGIRPKLQGPGDGFRDFYIQEESRNGLPGLINLIGIESPGLTASLAIAEYVAHLMPAE